MNETATKTRAYLRYAAVGAAALILAAGIVILIKVLSGPAPVDYKVTVRGVGSAMWISPDGSGQIDLTSGSGTQTVHAGKVAVTVNSTSANGASCQIVDPAGNVVDSQETAGGASSVTCSTE